MKLKDLLISKSKHAVGCFEELEAKYLKMSHEDPSGSALQSETTSTGADGPFKAKSMAEETISLLTTIGFILEIVYELSATFTICSKILMKTLRTKDGLSILDVLMKYVLEQSAKFRFQVISFLQQDQEQPSATKSKDENATMIPVELLKSICQVCKANSQTAASLLVLLSSRSQDFRKCCFTAISESLSQQKVSRDVTCSLPC